MNDVASTRDHVNPVLDNVAWPTPGVAGAGSQSVPSNHACCGWACHRHPAPRRAYARTALAKLITGLTGSRLTTDRVLFLSSLLLVVGSALVLAVGWWRLRGAQQALRSVIMR